MRIHSPDHALQIEYINKGFMAYDALTSGERFRLEVLAGYLTACLKSYDILEKYPASHVFDTDGYISGGVRVFGFKVMNDGGVVPTKSEPALAILCDTRKNRTPIDLIKARIWVDQIDDIMMELKKKIQEDLIHE